MNYIVFFTNKCLLELIYSCFADLLYDSTTVVVIYDQHYWYITQTDNQIRRFTIGSKFSRFWKINQSDSGEISRM